MSIPLDRLQTLAIACEVAYPALEMRHCDGGFVLLELLAVCSVHYVGRQLQARAYRTLSTGTLSSLEYSIVTNHISRNRRDRSPSLEAHDDVEY